MTFGQGQEMTFDLYLLHTFIDTIICLFVCIEV